MITIVTEMPSVAETIARIVGANKRQAGFFEGPEYYVTWMLGSLISLAPLSTYGYPKIMSEQLPLIPHPFKLIIRQYLSTKGKATDPEAIRQLKVVDEVFSKSESIIVATDAGQEGEVNFRWLYAYLGYTKSFQRLWLTSLADEAIREGLTNQRNGHDFDTLFWAAECRAKADWLVGVNASQALANVSGLGNNSLDRLQVPTLALICSRYLDNRRYTPSTCWQLAMTVRKGNAFRQFIHPERIGNRSKAEECYKRLGACERAIITVADRRKCYQRPPLLYDLTTLLQDCCQRLDFSSEQTLETAQALFEKQLISYPRTESRHIPERVMATIPALLERIFRQGEYIEFQRSIDIKRLPGWNVDKRNNHGHHAIIPTGIQPSQNLIEEERQVYRLIVLRMIEAFSPRCEKEQSFVGTNIDGLEFRSRTLHVIRPGWRSICRRVEDRDPHETDDETLVDFMVGEEVEIAACNLGKSHSIPKPFYTEASLLEAMSWAGKEDCAGAKRRVWTQGLGTPAARAGIISELFRRQYIERSAKTIIPTERGLYLYETLKGLLIANVGRTEQLENDLARIERREISPEHFMQALSGYVRQVAEEISSIHFAPAVSSISCPKCQEDRILLQRKLAKCNNENCDFVFSRAVLNKSLTDEQVEQLLTHGQTGVIEGFRNRGRKFDAVLRLDAEFHVRYVPMDKPEQKNT